MNWRLLLIVKSPEYPLFREFLITFDHYIKNRSAISFIIFPKKRGTHIQFDKIFDHRRVVVPRRQMYRQSSIRVFLLVIRLGL